MRQLLDEKLSRFETLEKQLAAAAASGEPAQVREVVHFLESRRAEV